MTVPSLGLRTRPESTENRIVIGVSAQSPDANQARAVVAGLRGPACGRCGIGTREFEEATAAFVAPVSGKRALLRERNNSLLARPAGNP
jgi:hypothetical protein